MSSGNGGQTPIFPPAADYTGIGAGAETGTDTRVPPDEQYPPPPGPPPPSRRPDIVHSSSSNNTGPASAGDQAQHRHQYEVDPRAFAGHDEKEVVAGPTISQWPEQHQHQQQVEQPPLPTSNLGHDGVDQQHQERPAQAFQMPGAVPYFPPPPAQNAPGLDEPDEVPPLMPPRPTPSVQIQGASSSNASGQDAVAHGLAEENPANCEPAPQAPASSSLPSGKEQEHEFHKTAEEHEAPPPYTLQDEGLYGPPMPSRPIQDQSLTDHATSEPTVPAQTLVPLESPAPPLPPRPQSSNAQDDEISNPIHYTRDPHRLIGYLVPFPKPRISGISPDKIPTRFLIYTPPPPPLQAPPEGAEESKINKMQRKWQNEVRQAKQSDAKLASWKGVKSRATKGISWAMGAVKSAELEFLTRVPAAPAARSRSPSPSMGSRTPAHGSAAHDSHADDGKDGNDHRTVGLEALDLVYPTSLGEEVPGGEPALRAEFISTMMRTRSKAQKDAVIATGLLPVSAAIDILATVIWPFGGLLEVDGVWAYASIRGAKTARSVTKRLASSTDHGTYIPDNKQDTRESLALRFISSSRLEVLRRYLAAKCVERDRVMFSGARDGQSPPTESIVLGAIGWEPSQSGGETRNWEDEQWETQEVKDDLKMVFSKAAKSWDKWCKGFEKNPEKALKH